MSYPFFDRNRFNWSKNEKTACLQCQDRAILEYRNDFLIF